MAEGLKMFHARHEGKNNKIIPIAEIGPEDRTELLCQYCNAKITWVDSYKRSGRTVLSYLRLRPNAEHAEKCKNRVKSAIENLVAHSQNVEYDKQIFDNNNAGFIFRMNVLIDATFDLSKSKKLYEEEKDPIEKERKRTSYRQIENKLADYFNSATGIAKIRAKIEESSDKKALSKMVKIQINKKEVSWNDFLYDEDRYPILFNKAEKIKHPVAIALTVKSASELILKSKKPFFTLKGEACHVDIEKNLKDYYSPVLNTQYENILDDLNPNDEIIIVGTLKTKTKTNHFMHITYKNLIFWIKNKKQFTKIDTCL